MLNAGASSKTGLPACFTKCNLQTYTTVDMAIHGVVCQKSDFYGNSDIQNCQKLDPLEITAKNIKPKYASKSNTF